MTTPSLDTHSIPTNTDPDEPANGSVIDGILFGSVRVEVDSNDVKLVFGAYLIDILVDSSPLIDLASPCVLGHYRAPG